jgi:transketolase N-terminal domain/subunit
VELQQLTNLRSNDENLVGYVLYLTGDCGETNGWENVAVVALARVEGLAVVVNTIEWTSTGKHTVSLQQTQKKLIQIPLLSL